MIETNCEKNCGNCKYNGYDLRSGHFICNNETSENYGCYNYYGEVCIDWEEKE